MQHTYDNSQITQFNKCRMSYFLKYICGYYKLDTADIDTLHLDFGKHYHDFMKLWYQRKMVNEDNKINVTEIWKTFIDRDGEQVKTNKNGMLLCKSYVDYWRGQDDFEVLEIEKPCVFDLGEFKFVVKRDGVIKLKDQIYTFEHKTASKLYNHGMKYFIDSQMSAETYATLLDYNECSGVLVNTAVPKYQTKPTLFVPGSPEINLYETQERKYCKYYKSDRIYCSGFSAEFDRDIVSRSDKELDHWKKNTIAIIEDIEQCKKDNRWIRADNNFTCSRCEYKEICKTSCSTEIDDSIVDVIFGIKENPLDYLELEQTKEKEELN